MAFHGGRPRYLAGHSHGALPVEPRRGGLRRYLRRNGGAVAGARFSGSSTVASELSHVDTVLSRRRRWNGQRARRHIRRTRESGGPRYAFSGALATAGRFSRAILGRYLERLR